MSARVINTVYGGGKVGGRRVVDRIDPDRFRSHPRAQRVYECLSCRTDTRCLGGAAGEYHLDVGARLRGRRWHGCAHQRPSCCRDNTRENSDMAGLHGPMLTYRDGWGDPNGSSANERRPGEARRDVRVGGIPEAHKAAGLTARDAFEHTCAAPASSVVPACDNP
jgi:hypothetical protein